ANRDRWARGCYEKRRYVVWGWCRRRVQATRFVRSWRMKSFVGSSVRFPSASNRVEAWPIITSGWLMGNMFRKTMIWRRWYCARAVPMAPIEAPMIAAGFPDQALSPYGRDAQSMEFFKT